MDVVLWGVGLAFGGQTLAIGWLFRYVMQISKELKQTEQRVATAMTYEQAEKLIDLKLAPVTQELANLTRATDRLAEVLMERK